MSELTATYKYTSQSIKIKLPKSTHPSYCSIWESIKRNGTEYSPYMYVLYYKQHESNSHPKSAKLIQNFNIPHNKLTHQPKIKWPDGFFLTHPIIHRSANNLWGIWISKSIQTINISDKNNCVKFGYVFGDVIYNFLKQ